MMLAVDHQVVGIDDALGWLYGMIFRDEMGDHAGGMFEPEDFRAPGFNLDDAFQCITAFWPGEPLCLGGRIAEGFETFSKG